MNKDIEPVIETRGRPRRRVRQYNKEGMYIKTYDEVTLAGKAPGNIVLCCQGKAKTAYGYIWKYCDVISTI